MNYIQDVPDSHFWTDLNQLIHFIETIKKCQNLNFTDGKKLEDYLIIGLKNTIKQGYSLKK